MSTTTEQDLGNIDLADQTLWDAGPPYDLFARMQREAPVHFSPQRVAPDEGGFWSITRHEDVRAVSRDFRTFSSERRGILHVDDVGVPLDVARLQMISMDPPRHDRLKALVSKAFTPERVAEHEGHVNQIITDVLDRVADQERFDLVADVARPIPARELVRVTTTRFQPTTVRSTRLSPGCSWEPVSTAKSKPRPIQRPTETTSRSLPTTKTD